MPGHRVGIACLCATAIAAASCGRTGAGASSATPDAFDASQPVDASLPIDAGCDETDDAFCRRLNAACGALTGVDACGAVRTVESCGRCGAKMRCAQNACTSCVDDAASARFATCRAASTEADCVAAGGDWLVNVFHPTGVCTCSTGEAACPCSGASDCTGHCIAPLVQECPNQGRCSGEEPLLDCWCVNGDPICFD